MSEIKNNLAPLDVPPGRGTRKLARNGTGTLGAAADATATPIQAAVEAPASGSPGLGAGPGPGAGVRSADTWAGNSGFAQQLAQENAGPALDSGMSEFRKQIAIEEARRAKSPDGTPAPTEPTDDFRRQMQLEIEKESGKGGEQEISDFRRQMLDEEKRRAGPDLPTVKPIVPDKPVDKPVIVDKPAVDKPVVVDKPVIDKPIITAKPVVDKPIIEAKPIIPDKPDETAILPPPGDKLAAVKAILGGDTQALANLDALAAQGKLAKPDMQGTITLLDHLATIATQPVTLGAEQRRALLADTLADVARPDAIPQPTAPADAAIIAAAQAKLAAASPAEYARLVAGLSGSDGKTNLNLSGTVARPVDWQPEAGAGSTAAQLLGDSFAAKVDGARTGNLFGQRFEKVLGAAQDDPAAVAGLGSLLLEGSLGNPDVRGETVLERLANLADPPKKPANASWKGALGDGNALVKGLIKAIAPDVPGPDKLSDPKRLWARSAPAEYVRIASELTTEGISSLVPETHFSIGWQTANIEPQRLAKVPPPAGADYLASFEWISPIMPDEMKPAVARLRTAMAGNPEAQTAIDLIGIKGGFWWSYEGELKTAIRQEQVERLADVAEGKTPLAAGVDPKQFVSDMLKGIATPSREIVQGDYQTCTVTSLQRIMAEESPSEYVRNMLDLASPAGKTALAKGEGSTLTRPADWNASAGKDNRDIASRLFQSTLMHRAVEQINQDAYKNTGFPASARQADTYDNATDSWTDALGRVRKGLPPDALNKLLADVENQNKVHLDVPQEATDLLNEPDFPVEMLLNTIFSYITAQKTETKVWRVPATLELTYPDGQKLLHEVLVSSVAPGPPPTATILDPLDGHSKQLDLVSFGKALRSISMPDSSAAMLQTMLPKMGAYAGLAGLLLGQMGGDAGKVIKALGPILMKWVAGGGTSPVTTSPLPATPPPGSPDPAELAPLTAALPPGDTPARFALDTLVRSGQLDQRTVAGRGLMQNLRDLAAIRQDDLQPGVDKAQLLSSVIREVANADPLVAPVAGDTTAAASAQRLLAATKPAEYVRLITDLAGRDGTAALNGGNGAAIALPADWQEATADSRAELADRLLQPALDQFARLHIAKAAGAPSGTMATGPLGSWAIADMVDGMFGQNNPRVRVPENAKPAERDGFVSRIQQQADLGKPVSVTLGSLDAAGHNVMEEMVYLGYQEDPAGGLFVNLLDPYDGTPKRMALSDFSTAVQAARIPPQDADPADNVSFGLGSYLDDDAGWGKSRFNTADAGWSKGRFVKADAGWGKGRFTGEDAGWGRSRMVSGDAGWGRGRFVSDDAGWGRSRYVSGDAGWGKGRFVRGDAGGGQYGVVGEDAGWGRSRLVANDAGWGKSRFVANDAGWGKGRFVRGDAGGGGQTFQEEIG